MFGRRRATCVNGKASKLLAGKFSSASPPTLTTHKVATARANHNRLARLGFVILVLCHCQPPRLVCLKPHSSQARIAYQKASACSGRRSVTINQASSCPSSQRANKVHLRGLLLKQTTSPHHTLPTVAVAKANERNWRSPLGR